MNPPPSATIAGFRPVPFAPIPRDPGARGDPTGAIGGASVRAIWPTVRNYEMSRFQDRPCRAGARRARIANVAGAKEHEECSISTRAFDRYGEIEKFT